MILFIAAASAGTTAEIGLIAGVRGNAESTLEQPEGADIENLEPSGTAAIVGEARKRWKSGIWVAGSGELWTYFPEPDPTLFRAVPALGGAFDLGKHGHLDVATRYSLEWVPLRADRVNGRAEATVKTGLNTGAHRLDVLAVGVSRDWFDLPQWSFRTGEAGLVWAWQPSAFRVGARATGQYNAGWTENAAGGVDPARGEQLRLGASAGWTGRAWDVGVEYRLYVADEGEVEDAARPQFTPVGDYDDDADALSAGGFTQHRVGLTANGKLGEAWTVDASVLARLRLNPPDQPSAALTRSFHVGADLGRSLGGPWSLHGVAALSTIELPDGETSYDPSAWLMLRWAPKGK